MTRDRLEIANLFVDRGRRPVLRDVHLALGPAEILTLLGANGAGKSTLVLAIGGVLPVRSGTMKLGDVSLVGAEPHEIRRHGIAIVHQGHPVLCGLTVLDNLRAAGLFLGKAEAERQVEAALAVLPELKPKLGIDANALSGGQKQMLCIAQALIVRPRFLLIDELSFGLAPAIVSRLGDVIRDVARKGVGVLLIEQFTSLALSLADRAMLLERGKIVFEGTAQELRDRPSILHGAYLAAADA
jgi:branched-chain amino acid transport system ATP-binding protein